ncbi:MAG TPA: endonuclease III [Candidatus Acidoferrales bacterium]|nr:endonuclease III [Candidatus Acidoferrales bacterium]
MSQPSTKTQSLMLRIIEKKFPVTVWKAGSPFETLVQTILSQNTNDRNSDAAMRKLRRRYRITPKVLSKAKARELIPYIKSAGLYRTKGPRIIQVSRIVQERYGGRLAPILNQPYEKAKEELMALPGVGPKTADILLAFVAKNPIIPVDTHISRVTKRLGIAKPNANYEMTRVPLENLIPTRKRVRVHLSIIAFGREICRAPRPRCPICPVNKWCPSSRV